MSCRNSGRSSVPQFPWAALAVVATVACSQGPRPVASPPAGRPRPDAPAAAELRRDIDKILGDPALEHGYWGALVKSLRTQETLYSLNPRKLMMPASNMKIVTLAAAADRLGWDYTYETRLLAVGSMADATLEGDLVVVGSGDPSFTDEDGMADRVFGQWAARLKELGITAIAGHIVGDDSAMPDRTLGFGWSWDDLQDDYAAGVGALQFNENMVRVIVTPGPGVGDAAGVALAPTGSGLTVASSVTTIEAGAARSITASRLPGSVRLELAGAIPLGTAPAVIGVSVDDPTLFFVSVLRTALIAHGIDVRAEAVVDHRGHAAQPRPGVQVVATHRSPPLSTLARRLMKGSQNQYAETLLTTVGAAAGAPTADGGRTAVQAALLPWGVPTSGLIQRDGSGLSRYDYVTPEALVTILAHVDRVETHRAAFEAALPVAGQDGTLANRMKGTPAEGNARAKTGSMANVRALSGYVTSGDGEPLVFAILANNFETPAELVVRSIDDIVVRLARFRR